MSEPDFAAHLIRAEQAQSRIYPLMIDRKPAAALLAANEVIRELLAFHDWVIRANTRGK